MTNRLATSDEVKWSKFAAHTPHYVVPKTRTQTQFSNTRIIPSIAEVAELKKQTGKEIYLMGGARLTASLIDAGIVDELRLIVYPLLAGKGKPLFTTLCKRQTLKLHKTHPLSDGRILLTYAIERT